MESIEFVRQELNARKGQISRLAKEVGYSSSTIFRFMRSERMLAADRFLRITQWLKDNPR